MRIRFLVASLGLATLAAAACKSSSPYSSPANVAVGTGLAVAAAAANRAVTHECWAACRPGTVCDRATGLCVEPGHRSGSTSHNAAAGSGAQSLQLTSEPYPAGHEYEVPPASGVSMADAGCAPGAGDAGAAPLFCEPDAGEPSSSY
jgi:hypothetical protein